MVSIEEYLESTESATKKLFEGVQEFLSILYEVETPVFVGSYARDNGFEERYSNWAEENEDKIRAKLVSQERYIDEIFAQSTLCGAILQIAAMGIKKYSRNILISEECSAIPGIKNVKKYCVGRKVRNLPIGLIIYAGRNQYNHLDDGSLREPSSTIFETIARVGPSKFVKEPYLDPCFDISNPALVNYASNITALIGWGNYEAYRADMVAMLSQEET